MYGNPEQFKDRFAYAPHGQLAVVWEWGMGGGGVLSIVAAYTVYGCTAWRMDNASIHRTQGSLGTGYSGQILVRSGVD